MSLSTVPGAFSEQESGWSIEKSVLRLNRLSMQYANLIFILLSDMHAVIVSVGICESFYIVKSEHFRCPYTGDAWNKDLNEKDVFLMYVHQLHWGAYYEHEKSS